MSRLPREFLWQDLESMDDFLSEPLNKEIYQVYQTVKTAPFRINIPDIQLFNELYYLCIAIVAKDIYVYELEKVVFARFGRAYLSDLLISMIYAVFYLQENRPTVFDGIDRFVDEYQRNKGWYFDYFYNFLINHPVKYHTDFAPHSESVELIVNQNLNWEALTNNYEEKSIMRILDLWNNYNDKKRIFTAIETSYRKSNGNLYNFKQKKTGGITTYTFNSVFQDIKDYLNAVNFLAHYEKPKKNPDPLTYPFIIHGEYTEEIEQKLHALLKGKTSPKDRMMPIRAAIDAGVIRRPTYTELQSTFGKDFVANSSYHNYTNPDKHPYDANPSFTLLVSEFKKIVE